MQVVVLSVILVLAEDTGRIRRCTCRFQLSHTVNDAHHTEPCLSVQGLKAGLAVMKPAQMMLNAYS